MEVEFSKTDSRFYTKEYSLNFYNQEKRNAEDYIKKIINPENHPEKMATNFVKPLKTYSRSLKKLPLLNNKSTAFNKFNQQDSNKILGRHYLSLWEAVKNMVIYFYLHDRGENVKFKHVHKNLKIVSGNFWKTYLDKNSIIHENPNAFSMDDHIDIWADITDILISRECSEWMKQKLKHALKIIPVDIIKEGGFTKVLRTIAGVLLFCITSLPEEQEDKSRKTEIFNAVKAGYYYGMMYPLIDDILDSNTVFSAGEKTQFNNIINNFVTGDLKEKPEFADNLLIMEVKNCFDGLVETLPDKSVAKVFNSLYMLYLSQTEDGKKELNGRYSDLDIYGPILIKAAYTRIIAASIAGIDITPSFKDRLFSQGLEMQLVDDFRDFTDDIKSGNFTPFVYYNHQDRNMNNINPMIVFLASLNDTIVNYNNNKQVQYVLAKRFSHGVKKHVLKSGKSDLSEFFSLFPPGSDKIAGVVQDIANNIDRINNLSVIIAPVIEETIAKELRS